MPPMNFYPLPLAQAVKGRARSLYSWRGLVVIFILTCIWGWFDVRRRGAIDTSDPTKHKTDLTVYTEAGAAFFDGREPYQVSNIRGWTYLYPPLFAMLMAPLHALPSQGQVMVWFALSSLICWGCYRECRELIRHVTDGDDAAGRSWSAWFPWLGIASFCAAVLPTMNCLQRGQVGVLKFYLLLLGVRLILSGGTTITRFLGGVVLALPVVLKVVPALPVGFFMLVLFAAWLGKTFFRKTGENQRDLLGSDQSRSAPGKLFFTSAAGLAVGLLLFFFVVPSAMVGWGKNWQNLRTWSQFVLTKADDGGEDPRSGNSRSGRNQSLHNAVYRFGNFLDHQFAGGPDDRLADNFERPHLMMDSASVEKTLLAARLAVLAALILLGFRLGMRGDRLSLAVAFSLSCTAMLVVSPVSRGHYFMLVCPTAIFVPWWLDVRGRFRAAVVLAVTPVLLVDVHYALMPYATRVGLLGLGVSVWLLTAMAMIARADRREKNALPLILYPTESGSTPAKRAA
jgi:hypothetical protein